MRIWFGAFGRRARRSWHARSDAGRLTPTPSRSNPFEPAAALFFDQTSWLPDNLLERGDRMMMAGSIEGRMPFMDMELAGV